MTQRPRTSEEEKAAIDASDCIKECHIEALITESKFLHTESLQQLVKHIILGSNIDQLKCPNQAVPDQNSEKNSRATSPSIGKSVKIFCWQKQRKFQNWLMIRLVPSFKLKTKYL